MIESSLYKFIHSETVQLTVEILIMMCIAWYALSISNRISSLILLTQYLCLLSLIGRINLC